VCAIAAVLGAAASASGQFGTSVNAVEVYASVTDAAGGPVQGLRRDQFTVYEDGQPQAIDTFIEAEFPLSIAVAIDRSLSMAGRQIQDARHAAHLLLRELRPADQSMVIAVSGEVQIVAPLSTDRAPQHDAIDRLDPWSTTALHDAVIAAIDRVQAGTGRRALVILSDGSDRYSEAGVEQVLERARASDVMVYGVALASTRPPLFVDLSVATGGRSFEAADRRALEAAMRSIARELRQQYLLGYTPSRPVTEGRGEWRSIRVDVDAPGARARARQGYVND
jgi:Ca-activated chloride channel family protein